MAKAPEFYCPLPITESLHKKDYKYGNIRRKSWKRLQTAIGIEVCPTNTNLPCVCCASSGERPLRSTTPICRMEIIHQHPGYEQPITAESGILLAAEAVREPFGRKCSLPLYKYPILIDFGTPDGRICVIYPSNFVSYISKEKGEDHSSPFHRPHQRCAFI